MDILKTMLERNPADSFARYGLAMEYANGGDLNQAITEYRALLEQNENYSAAYYHCGQAMEKLGRLEEARDLYAKGVEITTLTGDLHTRAELQAALDLLPL
jgi:tetratricopeptide (TPR) repeat protein